MSNRHVHEPIHHVTPRSISARGWAVIVLIGVVFIAAYAFVALLYNAEGESTNANAPLSGTQSAIVVTVTPVSVEPTTNQVTLDLAFAPQGDVADTAGRLTKNTRIAVTSSAGTQELKLTAGDSFSRMEVKIGTTGEEVRYPFDAHAGTFVVQADSYERQSDGSLTSTGDIPVGLKGSAGVAGWDTSYDFAPSFETNAIGTATFTRAFTTKAFAFVLIVLVVALSTLALVVALLVFSNRRKAEVALLGWSASLLFALPLLRTYLPGAPPIGAAIDIYIYLWVIVIAVISAMLSVIAWVRQSAVRHAS
jgi:hypothetical protein